jgi:cytochrome c oxidase subunit 2
MRSSAHVVTPAAFKAWLAERKAPAATAGGGKPDGKALFTDGNGTATACGSCHTLADAGTTATTGPDLGKVLAGKDAAFIRDSIVKPDAEIAPGYQGGIMPKNYGDTLSSDELDALVTYLGKVAGK